MTNINVQDFKINIKKIYILGFDNEGPCIYSTIA